MIARELFAQHVRGALTDLTSLPRLEKNPLAGLLAADRPIELTAAQALRQILREAIEALKPEAELPADHPEWLGYQLLCHRYLKGISQIATCEQLGLSRATYYRRHQELAEAVAAILWERYAGQRQEPAAGNVATSDISPDERARLEAVRLAQQAQRTPLNLDELLQGVIETIVPLAEQQGIALVVRIASAPPTLHGAPIVFRQIILNVLTEGIRLAAGSRLEFVVTPQEGQMLWQLRGLDVDELQQRKLEDIPGFVVSRGLLEVYGGRLWLDPDAPGGAALSFATPITRVPIILIIDDDADTVSLYRRYLEIHGYTLQAAHSSAEASKILDEERPDLILLDVLMPREDGWGILQRLKTMPQTADIPVVICSVLSQPQLALALGAARVLRKPILADTLVQTVQALLAQVAAQVH